jgi:1-acyl-sn-glycerol-3-phosphate acyltransferase
MANNNYIDFPRRRFIRSILKFGIDSLLGLISDLEIKGKENIPHQGPFLAVGNHFSFLDPVAFIHILPKATEFIGGHVNPYAPAQVTWLPKVYGVLPVHRGSISRSTLVNAERVLNQKGVLAIFPEGGSWAAALRPARPGAAFLALRTGVPVLPIGLEGFTEVFPKIKKGKRQKAIINIGKPFGPFISSNDPRQDREKLDEIGQTIMEKIAELLPDHSRGYLAEDPTTREAAKGTEIYPW